MIIRTLNGCNGRKLQSALMAEALLIGKKLTVSHPFVSFEVDDWMEFLKMYWHVCAEFSRDSRGYLMLDRTPIKITLSDGRVFETEVWFDAESKGLRYVSLR